jgi:hypothetical protein
MNLSQAITAIIKSNSIEVNSQQPIFVSSRKARIRELISHP